MNAGAGRPKVSLAVFAVGRRGAQIGERIQRQLGGDLFIPQRFEGAVAGSVVLYGEGALKGEIERAFRAYAGLVVILPVGAAVRLIAPLLGDKHSDPAVVAVDEAGAHAVALLSGHEGGANALAREVATAVGARPVITTAADVLGSLALDLLGKPWGWTIENPFDLTRASAAMIDGAPIGVYQDAGEEAWWADAPANLSRYASLSELLAAPVAARVVITDTTIAPSLLQVKNGAQLQSRLTGEATTPLPSPPPQGGRGPADVADASSLESVPALVYRPRTLVVGVGCVRGASADEIDALVSRALDEHELARASVRELATIDLKQDESGIAELARRNGWGVRFFSAAELAAADSPSGRSEIVERAVGTPAVCEPAAILAAGAAGSLVAGKTRTDRVTVAIAHAAARGRGTLSVVGLGPGAEDEMTPHARATLEAADDVVGYDGYLDQVRPWLAGKRFHGSPIGEEIERCRLAISLSRRGSRVALVSSGDAGVYGTAGIVLELLGEEGAPDEAAAVEIVPGVSAANAAAALLGAPLMSDFATISLSDLMTPWETIERRVEAVAASDVVLALYNPASARRRAPLERACAILRAHRADDTPVGLVRNASRPGQRVAVTDLEHLLDHSIDMLTIVLIGNSATIRVGDRLVTRRGYPVAQRDFTGAAGQVEA